MTPKPLPFWVNSMPRDHARITLYHLPKSAMYGTCAISLLKAKPPLYDTQFTPKTRCAKITDFEGGLTFTHNIDNQRPKHADVTENNVSAFYFTPKS